MVPLHILEDKEATVASITTTASALRPPAVFYYIRYPKWCKMVFDLGWTMNTIIFNSALTWYHSYELVLKTIFIFWLWTPIIYILILAHHPTTQKGSQKQWVLFCSHNRICFFSLGLIWSVSTTFLDDSRQFIPGYLGVIGVRTKGPKNPNFNNVGKIYTTTNLKTR